MSSNNLASFVLSQEYHEVKLALLMSTTELIFDHCADISFPWNNASFDHGMFYNTYYLYYTTLSSLSGVLLGSTTLPIWKSK